MWKDHYKIGVQQIDEQHKQLFGIAQDLLEAIKTPGPAQERAARQAIGFLKSYITVHFSTEEMYQQKIGYAGYSRHCGLHRAFEETVHELELELIRDRYGPAASQKLAGTLTAWLVYHVMREDRDFAPRQPPRQEAGRAQDAALYTQCFEEGCREVLERTTGMQVLRMEYGTQSARAGDIIIQAELCGPAGGTVSFALAPALAAGILEQMVGAGRQKPNGFIFAAHRQLAEAVCQNARARLEAGGIACTMGQPQVLPSAQPPPAPGFALTVRPGQMRVLLALAAKEGNG